MELLLVWGTVPVDSLNSNVVRAGLPSLRRTPHYPFPRSELGLPLQPQKARKWNCPEEDFISQDRTICIFSVQGQRSFYVGKWETCLAAHTVMHFGTGNGEEWFPPLPGALGKFSQRK